MDWLACPEARPLVGVVPDQRRRSFGEGASLLRVNLVVVLPGTDVLHDSDEGHGS